jgi:hypothetical protein
MAPVAGETTPRVIPTAMATRTWKYNDLKRERLTYWS